MHYRVLEASKTFAQWEAECRTLGGRLASINSKEEGEKAMNDIKNENVKFHGALTGMRKNAEDVFVNGDGKPLSYT